LFCSFGIREVSEILKKKKTRPRATNATREVVEQGILDTVHDDNPTFILNITYTSKSIMSNM
jgi:hypothetical protein